MLKKLGVALTFGLGGSAVYALTRWDYNKEIFAAPIFLIAFVMFGFGIAFAYFSDSWKTTSSALVKIGVFGATFILAGMAIGMINDAWPAEPINSIAAENQILVEAENWPVAEQNETLGTVGKFHRDPVNPDRMMLAVWFRSELFAKIIFLWSDQKPRILIKSQLAALKKENGDWIFGNYVRSSDAKVSDNDALVFKLFSNNDKNNPLAIRIFLLKDLIKPKN